MPQRSRQQTGKEAERLAQRHLEQHGLRLLAHNWLCKRGELDLVMLDGDTVVFVEVRYRLHAGFGGALDSIDEFCPHQTISAQSAIDWLFLCPSPSFGPIIPD